jgi:hypothetical protein
MRMVFSSGPRVWEHSELHQQSEPVHSHPVADDPVAAEAEDVNAPDGHLAPGWRASADTAEVGTDDV